MSPLFRAMRTLELLGVKKWLCCTPHWHLLYGFFPRICNKNQWSVWEPTALWLPLSTLNYMSSSHAPCFTAQRLIFSLLFAYFCLIFYMSTYNNVSPAGHSLRLVIMSHKSYSTTCVRANSLQRGDSESDLMQHVIVSSSVVQLSDLRCPSPAPLVLPLSAPMKTRALKGASGSFPSRILTSKCRNPFDTSTLVVPHPSSTWVIPLAGCSLLSGSPFPCCAFQNLTPNRSPAAFWSQLLR